MITFKKSLLTLAFSACSAVTVSAAIISVNLTDGGPGAGNANADDMAGAFLAPYWNTINGKTGGALNNTNASSLWDSDGNQSGVTYAQNISVGGTHQGQGVTTAGYNTSTSNKMMENFADITAVGHTDGGETPGLGSYTITFDNLNAVVGSSYDVYIYSARGFGNTGVSQFTIGDQSIYLTNENFTGPFVESGWSTQAEAEANLNSGNYIVFRGITLDELEINITALLDGTNGGATAAINGIQIVPEPSSLVLFGSLGLLGILRRRR